MRISASCSSTRLPRGCSAARPPMLSERVWTASSRGGSARRTASRDEVKVVITDMMMPYMDGPATIRALRRLDPKVKIIATSGLKAEDKISDAAQLGVKTFLPKPYTAEKLLKTVAALLKEEWSES